MLIKAFKLIKENILMTLVFFLLYSPFLIFNIFFATGLLNTNKFGTYMIIYMLSMFLHILLWGTIFLFFIGYSYMISEIIKKGKTKAKDIFIGIKKFFVRMLLASLLMAAVFFVVGIIIQIIMLPINMAIIFSSPEALGEFFINNQEGMTMFGSQQMPVIPEGFKGMFKSISILYSIASLISISFVSPLIALWIPSMYLDDIGMIESLKCGFFAGKKKYWTLVCYAFIIFLPNSILLFFYDFDMSIDFQNNIPNIAMMIFYPASLILYHVISFSIYDQYKNEQLDRVKVS